MLKKLIYLVGMTGLTAVCVTGCATKPTATISSQSEAVCIGRNMDRDVLLSQRDVGRTLIIPNDDPSRWVTPDH